jgi:hypothetical protein
MSASRLPGGLPKKHGLPSAKPWQQRLARQPSSGCLSARRARQLVRWWVGSSVVLWPSSTFAQSSDAPSARGSVAEATPADPYVIGGLIAAGALLITYAALRAFKRHEWPDVGDVISIVVPTTAVTAGIRVAVVAISARNVGPFLSEDRVFIPLAGLALVLVSARAIYTVMRDGIRAHG